MSNSNILIHQTKPYYASPILSFRFSCCVSANFPLILLNCKARCSPLSISITFKTNLNQVLTLFPNCNQLIPIIFILQTDIHLNYIVLYLSKKVFCSHSVCISLFKKNCEVLIFILIPSFKENYIPYEIACSKCLLNTTTLTVKFITKYQCGRDCQCIPI